MALTRAAPALLTDSVFASIHEAIMSGELPAGTPLRVRDLAAQVGTSVMPVREAIRRLEESGLAERIPHRGAVVKSLTVDELENVYDVRILLETEAAGKGAPAINAKTLATMRRECDQILRAVDEGRIIDALNHDQAMLTVLYGAAGNPILTEMISGLWQRCRPYKIRGAQRAQELSDATLWTFQSRILEAAERRDGVGAAEVTRESLLSAQARVRATFEDPQPIRAGS